jgi:hypothetical protein
VAGARLIYLLRAKASFTREELLSRIRRLIIAFTLLQIPAAPLLAGLINLGLRSAGLNMSLGLGLPPLLGTLTVHFLAALLIPWTAREAIRPILPFAIVYTAIDVISLVTGDSDAFAVGLGILLIFVTVIPGVAISWLRHSRFRDAFLNRAVRGRYEELSAELSTARRIHDRLFPLPIRDGPIRVEFAYEPMRAIGGDILYARRAQGESNHVDITLIDVTGHGIAAALAVNRLHAELNRIYGANAAASPRDIIGALNDYVVLTMASDRFFATAMCVRADPRAGTLTWSNAGHPPALLISSGAPSRRLDPTAAMLGVIEGPAFAPAEESCPFAQGDVLYAYSDGVTEARSSAGRMLTIEGLERLLTPRPTADQLAQAVQSFRKGPAQDDMLVVRIESHTGDK